MRGQKKRIGYLVRQVDDTVSHQIWNGIVEKSKELDVNVMAFIGDVLGKSDGNIAYELCNEELFDGIITWATSESAHLSYYEKYRRIPIVSLSLAIPGHPVVSIDCYSGMKSALAHLVKDHGLTKISFIRGPENHVYAQERYNAFRDMHDDLGLELDLRRVSDAGTWDYATGVNGVKTFLHVRNLKPGIDFQAVACANDYIALGAIEELKRNGYKVPSDLSVVGFNNTPEAESAHPPVTSVSMPYFEQGALALKTILDATDGKATDRRIQLGTTLVMRSSCGCVSGTIKRLERAVPSGVYREATEKKRIKIGHLDILSKDASPYAPDAHLSFSEIEVTKEISVLLCSNTGDDPAFNTTIEGMSERLVKSFVASLDNSDFRSFLDIIEEILARVSERECDIETWHNVMTIMREHFLPSVSDIRIRLRAQELFEQARVVISEVASRFHIFAGLRLNKKTETIRRIGSKLLTAFDLNTLYRILADGLQELRFKSFYLVLYDNPVNYAFPESLSTAPSLALAYSDGKNLLVKDRHVPFAISEILPERHLPEGRSYRLALAPLHIGNKHLGYLVLEADPVEKGIYGAIVEQLSSALMGSLLMREKEKTEALLEKTLETLQTKAKLVSSNSKQINQKVDDASANVEQIAANIRQISNRAEEVMSTVESAVEMVRDANKIIKGLKDKSDQISEITNLINDIADKTRILSLNANIEAARAGQYGKGFKVVAIEVRKLSDLTVKSTEEIKNVAKSIQAGSRESFEAIASAVDVINKVSDLSVAIKQAVNEQVAATNDAVNKLSETALGSKRIFEAINEVAYTTGDSPESAE